MTPLRAPSPAASWLPRVLAALVCVLLLLAATTVPSLASDPAELPAPTDGVRVVDPDAVLDMATRDDLQAIAVDIERTSGAQVAFVVTVTHGRRPTAADAQRMATALIDRWGIGRRDIDDGVVVLVMLDATRCHGGARIQVGRGVLDGWFGGDEATIQGLYADTMEPLLRECHVAEALLSVGRALAARAAAAEPTAAAAQPTTPLDHRAAPVAGPVAGPTGPGGGPTLSAGRPSDQDLPIAALVLGLAIVVGLLAVAWWWRDEASSVAPPPVVAGQDDVLPPGLTPALAATLRARGFSDDAFATALLDRAAHGQLRFRSDPRRGPEPARVLLVQPHLVPARADGAHGAPARSAPRAAHPAEPSLDLVDPGTTPGITDAETIAERRFAADLDRLFASVGGVLPAIEAFRLAPARRDLGRALECELVDLGLLRRTRAGQRLVVIPAAIVVCAGALGGLSAAAPAIASAWVVAAALVALPLGFIGLVARPPLTPAGARVAAGLASLRMHLLARLHGAPDLLDAAAAMRDDGIAGLDTPDRLVVWSTALGLTDELGQLLWRTANGSRERPTEVVGATRNAWWTPLSRVLVFQMLVDDLGSVMGTAPGDHAGLLDAIPGFGGGISLGGGGGGGSF